ncbi:MAG: AAA family ATPase [Azospirillaceae bacterium]|nr:AAA family ATPase [Azospirillaceae bacterium]
MTELISFTIRGFRSIQETRLDLDRANVLIGANGSGKSNLIAFFRFLSFLLANPSGSLQRYVAENGGANAILFNGAKRTHEIEAGVELKSERGINSYRFRLFYAAPDTLIFADEACRFLPSGTPDGRWTELGSGHREAQLLDRKSVVAKTTRSTITALLRGLVVYHFQDTSREARIKTRWPIDDSTHLKYDAANIAPFLLSLREEFPVYYRRIVETVRQVAPFFNDFVLEVEYDAVLLRWSERGSDVNFSVDQASDGTLRAIALITALLQPPTKLPSLIILDEPELGLHPYALNIISGLIRSAAVSRQVLLATQAPALLDGFLASDIIVAERDQWGSHFRRLNPEQLDAWLDDYALSELWNRNILGGRPKEVGG